MKNAFEISKKIIWLRSASFCIIAFERFSAFFWRVLTWVLLFAAIWLFGLPAAFGQGVSVAAAIIFVVGVCYFIWCDGRGFRLPSRRDVDRRIEVDSGVRDRPLSQIDDRLANADQQQGARQLWVKSREALLALLPRLHPAKIRGYLAARDPYAIRLFVFMAFVLGMVTAGPEWSMRLKNGVIPFSFGIEQTEARSERFTIIITAPEYTALPQMILHDHTIQGETLTIIEGSRVKVLVNDGWWRPRLLLGDKELNLEAADDKSFAIEALFPETHGDLKLTQGFRTLGYWPFKIVPDTAPSIALLDEAPQVLDDGTVQFSLSVNDDFGVQFLDAEMNLAEVVEDAPFGEAVTLRRSVVSPDGEDFELAPIYDFSAHSWAGLPAEITFRVLDEKGQESTLAPITFTLPEREFQHPIAKTLVAIRKKLAWAPLDNGAYERAAYELYILKSAKEMMNNDIVVYMAIRSASLRLALNDPSLDTTREVMALMWDTALRVEDGDLSLAARRLRDAQMALEDALQDPNLDKNEISELMRDLREAMAEYFAELSREMQKRMAQGQEMPNMPDFQNKMNQQAFQDFLEKMEQMMRDGDTASAQEMLSQMQRLIDMLNPSMNAQMPPDMQMMQKGVNELEELIKRQEELLAQTQKQADMVEMLEGLGLKLPMNPSNDAQIDTPPFVNTEANQTEQDALRFMLGNLMVAANEAIGEIPDAMGLAEIEMRGSSDWLGVNFPQESVPHQEQAIEYLKQSQDEMAQQLQQRMVQMTGFMMSFGQPSGQRDPLGRPSGGENGTNGDPNSNVTIPDEAERRRAQEILQILRRRAGEHDRPREEIEYYRRLLKRF